MTGKDMQKKWNDEELQASVDAYIDMLRKHRAGAHFAKKDYYAELCGTYGRTEKSFEYRMQNISHVLALMDREWLPGLKPAKNVGSNNEAKIKTMLMQAERK